MYTSFQVKNYRCFEDLTVEPLERVNLIAGKNNVGKTALLEALYVHSKYDNPWAAANVNYWRGLVPKRPEFLWDLFREFDSTRTIELRSTDLNDATHLLRVTAKQHMIGVPVREPRPATGFTDAATRVTIGAEIPRTVVEPQVTFHYCGTSEETQICALILGADDKFRTEGVAEVIRERAVFLTAHFSLSTELLAAKLSNLVEVKTDSRATQILQLLEPRLKHLQPLSPAGRSSIFCDVGLGRLMPLGLMGDGLGRLLGIVLAIIEDPEIQVLFVDEIDSGFHHSVMADIWKAIALAAREFDVQVFATTHSDECISAAHQAFSKSETYDFRLHRLELVKDKIQSVTFDQETLDFALSHNWEVR
jgi:hypothetical protein